MLAKNIWKMYVQTVFYLCRGFCPDELLINMCCSPCQLLWTVKGFEFLTGKPKVQVLLTEL